MYKITALDHQISKQEPTTIAKHPFSYYSVGGKGSGKTTKLLNLLLKPEFYKGFFNKVFLISPTNKLDSKLNILRTTVGITAPNYKLFKLMQKQKGNQVLDDPLQQPNEIPEAVRKGYLTDEHILETLDLDWLQELIDTQKYIISTYGKANANKVLMILDDSISSKVLKTPRFLHFLLNSRHYNISTIFVSQSYILLPRSIRINNSFISIFEVANLENLKQIYSENPAGLDFKTWVEVYNECVREDFGFLSISYQNPKKFRLIRNLEEFLYIE